jgi:transcriptional regulator with XRE-family HTH domain
LRAAAAIAFRAREITYSIGPRTNASTACVDLSSIFSRVEFARGANREGLVMLQWEAVASFPATGEVATGACPGRRLHRIAEVRRQQGMSMRTVARHMNAEARALKQQEEESSDLKLSELYRWQDVLGVPVADLLVESSEPLSAPVLLRARMIKVMKTVAALMETADTAPVRRLAQTLHDQLVEIMPELEGVSPWPAVGQRRSLDDVGRAAERRMATAVWREA